MATGTPDTERLIEQAAGGDDEARQQLLARHRARLHRMIAVRMDRRLSARVAPSDLVQEVLIDAARALSDYLRRRPLPFYAWLRQFAWDRLLKLHRHHIRTRKRSVDREQQWALPLPGGSVMELARRLVASGTSPSRRLVRDELRDRLRVALALLSERDREVLVLRHLEQLSTAEVAAVLGISVGAVMTRHTRALERLRNLLDHEDREDLP